MKGVAKVAVSIPLATLKSLERARARLKKSRSAVVTEAIDQWLRVGDVDDRERRYVAGYLRHPERTDEAVALAAVELWDPWE